MSSASATVILSEVQSLKAVILSLQGEVGSLKTLLSSKALAAEPSGSVGGKKPKKEKKEKDPNAPKRERTEWGLFTDKIRALLKENGYSGMDLAVGCLQFCKALKTENADFASWEDSDVLARRSAWEAPEPKAKAASVASGPAEEELEDGDGAASAVSSEKKKRGPAKGTKLTEEQKAQRKATREANKVKKEGASEAPASAPASPVPASAAKSAPAAKSSPAPVTASEPSDEFKPTLLQGKKYFINLKTGHSYHRNDDGSQGDWAGLFSRVPKPHIDAEAPEPTEEEGDDLCLDE